MNTFQLIAKEIFSGTHTHEEESKSNLNMAIKSQNHVVDGCTTDVFFSRNPGITEALAHLH
jgi:hypothetical protein